MVQLRANVPDLWTMIHANMKAGLVSSELNLSGKDGTCLVENKKHRVTDVKKTLSTAVSATDANS